MTEQHHLINVGYRLLGSLTDAEDVVQETYARWYALTPREREAIEVPGAWLTRVVGRICLDLLRSARVRRETYVGEWIPEPLPERVEWRGGESGTAGDPADRVTLDESVGMAFLVMLESMTPAERVAFILHDVFGYPFAQVADIVGRTPEACRQLASAARRRTRPVQPPAAPPSALRSDTVRAFKDAWQAGNVDSLIGLLDPDGVVVVDGGGLATAALRPVHGAESIARYFTDITDQLHGVTILERTVNGQPGLVAQADGATVTVLAFGVIGDRISHIWAVRNPYKLRPWT